MPRISSKKYLAGSKGQACTLRIPNVCNNDPETVVPAHIRDRHKGGGNKASDISVANACFACHSVLDGHGAIILTPLEWSFYALRGLQETLEQRHEAGLLIVPQDPPTERVIKPRKKGPKRPISKPSSPIKSRGFKPYPSNVRQLRD